jgi:hypothetical protein
MSTKVAHKNILYEFYKVVKNGLKSESTKVAQTLHENDTKTAQRRHK